MASRRASPHAIPGLYAADASGVSCGPGYDLFILFGM